MNFDSLLGNAPIKAYLRKAILQNALPHALLFSGPDGIGKSLFAKVVAQMLLQADERVFKESHPDFHPIRPEGKTGLHSMETIRRVIDEVYTTPFEAPRKVFVIYDAHRMQAPQANALLKTLEEPNPDTTFILLTSHFSEIIPTIRSRLVRLYFQPLSEKDIALFLKEKNLPEHLAKQAHGSLEEALHLSQLEALQKEIFPILSRTLSYPQKCIHLEKIDALIEDEDPVKKQRNVEYVFTSMLMWYRDQAARPFVGSEELFFPESLQENVSLSHFNQFYRLLVDARSAFERNIKLSVCLEAAIELRGCRLP